MPTKKRTEAEKYKMAGWTYFPFDVIDWLTSDDVRRMTMAERGMYIDLLAIQWRDGYVSSDGHLAGKQLATDRRHVVRWMSKWGHLFVISPSNPSHLINVKLNEIAMAKGNPKAEQGTEERREEKRREEDTTLHNTRSEDKATPNTLCPFCEKEPIEPTCKGSCIACYPKYVDGLGNGASA